MLKLTQIEQLLSHYPILAELPDTLRATVFQQAQVLELTQGQLVFTEQQSCQAFPFMLTGSIRVYKVSESGRELPLYRVAPGDACVVSSGCLLQHQAYNARGSAQEDSQIVLLPEAQFEALMGESRFRSYIFALFGERLNHLMQLVEEVAFHKLDQRLARLLLRLGPELNFSHQQLADELGSVREIISRLLRNFSEAGFIQQSRERIKLLDPLALGRIAEH